MTCLGAYDGACRAGLLEIERTIRENVTKPSVTQGPCFWKKRKEVDTNSVEVKKLAIERRSLESDGSLKTGSKNGKICDPRSFYHRDEQSQQEKQQKIIEAAIVHFPDANCLPNFQNVWDIPKYLPCEDFDVAESTTVTTSIFVPSLANIIHSTDSDIEQILKCELTSRHRGNC